MSAQLIKISEELLASVGAKTPDDFCSKLASFIASAVKLPEQINTLNQLCGTQAEEIKTFKAKFEAADKILLSHGTSIEGLTSTIGKPGAITEANIRSWASEAGKTEGSRVAMEAIGGLGHGAPPAPPTAKNGNAAAQTQFTQLILEKKYKDAWAIAPAEVKAEFDSAETYAAFMKADKRGQIRTTKEKE